MNRDDRRQFIDDEPALFSALLKPHRSLGRTGLFVLMAFVGVVSFVAGLVFLSMGAWPVFGFFGLDALQSGGRSRSNFHRGAAYEEIRSRRRAACAAGQASGPGVEWTVNPLWVRLDGRTATRNSGRAVVPDLPPPLSEIASFLGADEKHSFAKALMGAINTAKRGREETLEPCLVSRKSGGSDGSKALHRSHDDTSP